MTLVFSLTRLQHLVRITRCVHICNANVRMKELGPITHFIVNTMDTFNYFSLISIFPKNGDRLFRSLLIFFLFGDRFPFLPSHFFFLFVLGFQFLLLLCIYLINLFYFIYSFAHLFIYLSIVLSIYLFIYLFICLFFFIY